MKGRLQIRPADLAADATRMIEVLRRHLNPDIDRARFEWLYHANPCGPARAWLAVEPASGEIAGVCSAFPRRVYAGAAVVTGWVLGDFCFAPEYRTVGPALRLQRACLDEVDGGAATFCYDFPSATMTAVYARLGIKPFGHVVRFAKPLRVDRKVASVLGAGPARWLSPVGNVSLALGDRCWRATPGIAVSLHEGACGSEFSALAQRIGGSQGVCVERSAAYLNWRYLGSPARPHEILVARRGGALRGYAAIVGDGEDAILADLFGDADPEVVRALVRSAVELLRRRGVTTVSAPLGEAHFMIETLQSLGFRARERAPVIVYKGHRRERDAVELESSRWCLTHGDRDS